MNNVVQEIPEYQLDVFQCILHQQEKKPLVPDPDHHDVVPIEPSVLASAIPEPRSLMHHALSVE